ncbi:MAG: nuclear transport factor 2 family protein [Gemmatimonadota bacterium]
MLMKSMVLMATALVAVGPAKAQDSEEQVRSAEVAFAQTMADRNLDAFGSFVSEEAIFFGAGGALRGREAVVEGWRALFEGSQPPFSWEPETVEVLESRTLAHSSGPVKDPQGNIVATFNSIWRLEADGKWRVVFDKGCAAGGE